MQPAAAARTAATSLLLLLLLCCAAPRNGCASARPSSAPLQLPPVIVVEASYERTSAGYYSLGHQVGSQAAAEVQSVIRHPDPELALLLNFTATNATAAATLARLVNSSRAAFPLHFDELRGLADGAAVDLHVLTVHNFREELIQIVPRADANGVVDPRPAKCSTIFVNQGPACLALGHNDDWTQNWRGSSYFVVAEERPAPAAAARATVSSAATAGGTGTTGGGDGDRGGRGGAFNDGAQGGGGGGGSAAAVRWGTWVYPGYLPGMDVAFNSHGVVYSVNSLFSKRPLPPGDGHDGPVGTAFVARNLLGATSVADAARRVASPGGAGPASAMSYNLGSWVERRLVELEVDTGGASAAAEVAPGSTAFHGNEFVVLRNATQFPDNSTAARAARFAAMLPLVSVGDAARFLGDTQGRWPVYRNRTEPDDCFTEVTAIFDLLNRTLSVWATQNPKDGPPQQVFDLEAVAPLAATASAR